MSTVLLRNSPYKIEESVQKASTTTTVLGLNLARARTKQGLTQRQASELTGHPVTSISDWERGTRAPGIAILIKMARAYNTTLDELVLGVENQPTDIPTRDEWKGIRVLLHAANKFLSDERPESQQRAVAAIEAASTLADYPALD